MNAPTRSFGQRRSTNPEDPFNGLWRLKVGDRIFGPYTGHQMVQFRSEGRLAAHSVVCREAGPAGDALWHTATSDTVLGSLFRSPSEAPVFGQKSEPGGSKFVITIELKGGHSAALEAAITGLGPAHRLAPNLWILAGNHTVGGLRNHLSQFLGPMDSMLIIDATQGRTGGFNLGPENDAHIRRVWRDA